MAKRCLGLVQQLRNLQWTKWFSGRCRDSQAILDCTINLQQFGDGQQWVSKTDLYCCWLNNAYCHPKGASWTVTLQKILCSFESSVSKKSWWSVEGKTDWWADWLNSMHSWQWTQYTRLLAEVRSLVDCGALVLSRLAMLFCWCFGDASAGGSFTAKPTDLGILEWMAHDKPLIASLSLFSKEPEYQSFEDIGQCFTPLPWRPR